MPQWISNTPFFSSGTPDGNHTITIPAAQAESKLVAIFDSASVMVWPSPWVRKAQALSDTELSLYTADATTGQTTVTFSTSANYGVSGRIYEFAAGSDFVSAQINNSGNATTGPQPSVTTDGSAHWLLTAYGHNYTNTVAENLTASAFTWDSGAVGETPVIAARGTQDSSMIVTAYLENSTATTWAPTITNITTVTGLSGFASQRMTAVFTVVAPTVQNPTVIAAPAASIAAQMNVPAYVTGSATLTGGGPMSMSFQMLPPTASTGEAVDPAVDPGVTPLELPTVTELENLENNELDEVTAIQMAADLFTMATGITDEPTDGMQRRLIKYAILEMAWALRTQHDDFEAQVSPFSGERIGSYSYQKAQSAISQKSKTGVPFFDQAVAWFNQRGRLDMTAMTSEWVFKQGVPWDQSRYRWLEHDPSNAWPWM